jgi:hypothetical protein
LAQLSYENRGYFVTFGINFANETASKTYDLAYMSSKEMQTLNGKASTIKTTYSRETAVHIDIKSTPERIWQLLTNAKGYGSWNSTIVSLDGDISPGGKIKLVSQLDPKRSFRLTIKEWVPNKKMVWGDSKGSRIYLLNGRDQGSTQFSMTEKIGGWLFPLYAKYIPSFDESFEQFAADLKKAAENNSNYK